MSKKPERSQKQSLNAQREAVLKLADLQKELRDALHANLKKNGTSLGTLTGKADVDWKSIHGVYTGTRALGGGKTLKRLTAYLGKPRLETDIVECTGKLSDRLVGLSVLEKKQIQTVFDVHEIFLMEREARESLTFAAFSKAFDEQQDTVFGILNWQVDAVRRLNDEAASAQLEELLTSKELSRKITKIVKQETDEQIRLAAELKSAAERLLKGQIIYSKLAPILGISASNLRDALSGRVPQARLDELIGQINQKLGTSGHAKDDKADVTRANAETAKPSDNPSLESARSLTNLIGELRKVYGNEARLAKDLKLNPETMRAAMNGNMSADATHNVIRRARKLLGNRCPTEPSCERTPPISGYGGHTQVHGEISAQEPSLTPAENPVESVTEQDTREKWPMGKTSEEGVPFVLDKASFTPFAFRPAPEDIKYTARQIQHVRSLLNVLTQISDDGIRETVRLTLSPEVEELAMTIRLFTEEFPNRMLELFDAERRTMMALGLEPGQSARKDKLR